eukprot:CAMPEP_0198110108 /NCGR_PEP_ID=MMETSP1442-20131203/2150_1 /TAXON_ID= /ORGANISM="Craspedostauros australis, Strain CCMP3328" /LENGTH=31 /DNA_ID= /DNA_START= /DNA_END= /DNA_ORIENTATION=
MPLQHVLFYTTYSTREGAVFALKLKKTYEEE